MGISKALQKEINYEVEKEYNECFSTFSEREYLNMLLEPKQLNYCQACVYSIDEYFILKSYDTIIACINVDKEIMVDFLRLVYGYTATSAQHISKFKKLYSQYYCMELQWRDIK